MVPRLNYGDFFTIAVKLKCSQQPRLVVPVGIGCNFHNAFVKAAGGLTCSYCRNALVKLPILQVLQQEVAGVKMGISRLCDIAILGCRFISD